MVKEKGMGHDVMRSTYYSSLRKRAYIYATSTRKPLRSRGTSWTITFLGKNWSSSSLLPKENSSSSFCLKTNKFTPPAVEA